MAQLGARFHGMEEVTGSIPVRSTNKPSQINHLQPLPNSIFVDLVAFGSKLPKPPSEAGAHASLSPPFSPPAAGIFFAAIRLFDVTSPGVLRLDFAAT